MNVSDEVVGRPDRGMGISIGLLSGEIWLDVRVGSYNIATCFFSFVSNTIWYSLISRYLLAEIGKSRGGIWEIARLVFSFSKHFKRKRNKETLIAGEDYHRDPLQSF